MINKVILMGRLCADPELRNTQSGIAVCRFRIAVNRQYSKNSDQKADFINIVSWRQQAEFVNRYFHRGSMIIVEGKLQNADYTDSNGVKHYAMDVQADNVTFGESKAAQNATQSDDNSQPQKLPTHTANGLQRAADAALQQSDAGRCQSVAKRCTYL